MSQTLTNSVKCGMPSLNLGWMMAPAAVIALSLCASAQADFKSLAQKLPASSNAVVAVNVAKLLNTPYAKSEWTPNTVDAWAKDPLMIPPGSTRLLMASEIRTDTMEPIWELTLMEMPTMPTLESLAAADGGHIDRLWDKDAVCSPINAYFVPLDGTTLASITPANRSAIAKWVRTPIAKPEGNVTSDYLQKVLAGLGDNTDIVLAMDLEGAYGVPRIRKWLDENDIKGVKETELDGVAGTIGTLKGITVVISIDKDVNGRAIVEFGRDAAPLKDCAKAVLTEVLNAAGMRIDDLKEWTVATAGKQVTMEGKMSTPSLRKLLGTVQSPIPAATVAEKSAPGKAATPPSPADASLRYYKAITASLDNFRGTSSASESASWARATTKRIDQLPILNVDPQLVQWGAMVSTRLKQAGAGMAIAQTQMKARVAGVQDPTYSTGSYDNYGEYHSTQNTGEMENAARQRRQAALEQKAQAQEQIVRILTEIAETRPKIRAEMVEKYKVEF